MYKIRKATLSFGLNDDALASSCDTRGHLYCIGHCGIFADEEVRRPNRSIFEPPLRTSMSCVALHDSRYLFYQAVYYRILVKSPRRSPFFRYTSVEPGYGEQKASQRLDLTHKNLEKNARELPRTLRGSKLIYLGYKSWKTFCHLQLGSTVYTYNKLQNVRRISRNQHSFERYSFQVYSTLEVRLHILTTKY